MRPYEIAVIFSSDADTGSVDQVLERVSKTIESSGGKAHKINRWGKKTFAYEINHRTDGNYVIVEANIEPAAVAETDRMLFLADEVIRHKIIRMPEGPNIRTSAVVSAKAPERERRDRRERS